MFHWEINKIQDFDKQLMSVIFFVKKNIKLDLFKLLNPQIIDIAAIINDDLDIFIFFFSKRRKFYC